MKRVITYGVDREKLEKMIIDSEAEEYIRIYGRKKNVENYLREADIYISTSRTEGLPLSILEAMACGLPIVATRVGGVVDIVSNNINGCSTFRTIAHPTERFKFVTVRFHNIAVIDMNNRMLRTPFFNLCQIRP